MSLLTALEEASEATRAAISLLQRTNNILELLQDYTGDKRTTSYIDHKTIRDLTLSNNINDLDWVEPAVDRLNVAVFTTAMWSNNVQYDEAISNFYSLLIPKQLHDRDDIIDLFLDVVATWTIAETRWPIAMHMTTDVVTIIKQRIEENLKCQSPLLCQKILNAFDARFKHLDSTGLDALIINANKRMKETWFKVLPVILKAIDGKHNTTLYPKRDYRQPSHYHHPHQQHTSNNSYTSTSHINAAPSSSDDIRNSISPMGAYIINSRIQDIDGRTSIRNDDSEIPDEQHTTGMKRSHDQQKADVATVDKHHRSEPIVISEISEDDDDEEESQDSSSDSTYEDEYDDARGDSRQHSQNMVEQDNSSSKRQRPLNTINLVSPSPILISDDDEPALASNARQKQGQDDVARSRATRASNLLSVSGTSKVRQQANQANSRSMISVISAPSSVTGTTVRKSRRWTEKEITALEKGIELHGRQWTKIRAENHIFRHRTGQQLCSAALTIARRRAKKGQPLGCFECMK